MRLTEVGTMIKASRCQLMVLAALVSLSACNPTIKVEAPDKPITINMNIKHEIRVKVEKDLENVLSKDSGLF